MEVEVVEVEVGKTISDRDLRQDKCGADRGVSGVGTQTIRKRLKAGCVSRSLAVAVQSQARLQARERGWMGNRDGRRRGAYKRENARVRIQVLRIDEASLRYIFICGRACTESDDATKVLLFSDAKKHAPRDLPGVWRAGFRLERWSAPLGPFGGFPFTLGTRLPPPFQQLFLWNWWMLDVLRIDFVKLRVESYCKEWNPLHWWQL